MTEHNHPGGIHPANRSLEGDLSMPLPEWQGITSSGVFCRVSINRYGWYEHPSPKIQPSCRIYFILSRAPE